MLCSGRISSTCSIPKAQCPSNAHSQPIVRDGSGLRFRAASVIVDRNKIIETEERPYSEAQGPSRVYFHFMYRSAHYTKEIRVPVVLHFPNAQISFQRGASLDTISD